MLTARSRRLAASIGAAAIGLTACALRLWTLGDKNIWVDESASWVIATASLPQLLARTAADIHPPLYYLTLKAWITAWGDSPATLRGFSVAASLMTLVVFWRLARPMLPRAIALAALAWLALSPHDIAYAQEARMYAPVTALVLAACLAYRRWVESDFVNRRALVVYAGCGWAAVSMHYFVAFVLGAIVLHAGLLALWRGSTLPRVRVHWRPWLVANGAIVLAYGVWMDVALNQLTRGQPWRPRIAFAGLPHAALETARAFLFSAWDPPPLRSWTFVVAVATVAVGLLVTCVQALRRGNAEHERDAFWAIVGLAPLAVGLAMLPFAGDMDLSRYLAYSAPLVMLAVARGLAQLPMRPWPAVGALMVVAALPLGSLRTYYASTVKDYDARPLAVWLDVHTRDAAGAHDQMFIAPGYTAFVFQYVARDLWAGQLDTPEDLDHVETAAASSARPVWLVADYRWPGFTALTKDRCLQPVTPVAMDDARVKVFRVRCAPGASDPP